MSIKENKNKSEETTRDIVKRKRATRKTKVQKEQEVKEKVEASKKAQELKDDLAGQGLITPADYFEYVKSKKQTITSKRLKEVYENTLMLIKRYIVTGQTKPCEKLLFLLECIEKETKVVEAGYNHYVNRWDIERYIEKISDKSICMCAMKDYERDYPDEVIDKIIEAKKIFGEELYVIFTDYTGKETRKVAKERREKDPILFGAIRSGDTVLDRLYFICDWVDDYCDLTLDKLTADYSKLMNKKKGKTKASQLIQEVQLPDSIEDIRKLVKGVTEKGKGLTLDYHSIDEV